MEAIRIIREMRYATNGRYPEIALFENVPGLLSSGENGSDYKTVLEAFTEGEIPIPRSGHWANAGMVRGKGLNLAWIIKDASKHFGVPQRRRRLFLVCDFTESGQRAAKILFITKSLSGYFAARERERKRIAAPAESSTGSAGGDSGIIVAASGQVNAELMDNLSPTLTIHHEQPYLCEASSIETYPSLTGTLCASGAGLSRPAGMASETDLCVAAASVNCRNMIESSEISGTLQSKSEGGYSLNYQNPVRTGYIIRRLTPTEAERLMSLPDDWTKYDCGGKLMSDTARYQLCGNSIVVNVLAYIMQNIAECLKN